MTTRKQLDREIADSLTKERPRRHHSTIGDHAKDTVVALLSASDAASRDVARDLLLKHGIIQTGRITRFDPIGESFSGPIFQINIGRKHYWMVYDFVRIPGVGAVFDFTVTDELPPRTIDWPSPSKLKQQLHPVDVLHAKHLPESLIRRWVEKWWIE